MGRTATADKPRDTGSALDDFELHFEEVKGKNKWGLSTYFLTKGWMELGRPARLRDIVGSVLQQWAHSGVAVLRRVGHFLTASLGVAYQNTIKRIDLLQFLCIIKTVTKTVMHKNKPKEGNIMAKGNKNSDNKVAPTEKKAVTSGKNWYKHDFILVILGIGLALVFVSVAYMLVVIFLGTQGLTSRIMMAPAALFELVLAAIAFGKILK